MAFARRPPARSIVFPSQLRSGQNHADARPTALVGRALLKAVIEAEALLFLESFPNPQLTLPVDREKRTSELSTEVWPAIVSSNQHLHGRQAAPLIESFLDK